MHGMIPQDMRRNLFYIENQTELSVISGREGGDDLWQPRPRLPANCRPIVYWADRMMVLYGDSEVVALDSKDKGKVVWRYTLRAGLQLPPEISPDAQKIVITYPSGTLSVLDAVIRIGTVVRAVGRRDGGASGAGATAVSRWRWAIRSK